MATRGEIRDAFTSELYGVSGTYNVTDENGNVIDTVTLSTDEIGLRNPEFTETLPEVVYHENYIRLRFNEVGRGPDMVDYNDDGSVNKELWREYIEAQFIIDIRASNEVAKEPLYEALREQFGKYQFGPWDEKSLNADIIKLDVVDANTADTGDTDDVIRGDQIEVRVQFYRDYAYSTDNITLINTAVDVNSDDIDDITYQTT